MSTSETDPTEKRLSNRQREALPHIVGADSLAEGARRASIGRATIYRWMEDDDFRTEIERLRAEMSDLAQAEVQGLMLKAVVVIDQALDGDVSPVQLRAALGACSADDLRRVVVAYEPVWAIGTGRTASVADADAMHREVRAVVAGLAGAAAAEELVVQYGGSVKPDNAAELLASAQVDGLLVGGASLQADSFARIVAAAGR